MPLCLYREAGGLLIDCACVADGGRFAVSKEGRVFSGGHVGRPGLASIYTGNNTEHRVKLVLFQHADTVLDHPHQDNTEIF